MTDDSALLDWLETQIADRSAQDILAQEPGIDLDRAYRLQFALMQRRAARGDRLVGYKAAYTSKAMQKANGMDEPIYGSLLASRIAEQDAPQRLFADRRNVVEPEIAIQLKRDLAGPGVTAFEALGAVEGCFAAIELAEQLLPPAKRSRQMGIAVHKTNGAIVLGTQITSASGIDLRLEGCAISVNGETRGSGTGVEVLGTPLNVVAAMANKFAAFGLCLKAGMILMTGSVVTAVPVAPGDDVLVEFARLGTVRMRLT
jgi:2-keto-4-pentenoate hydratase